MNLNLNADERDYLLRVLREELGRLKAEIHRTEAADFKEGLRSDADILQAVIARLETEATDSAS
jgi:hypothetical protein